MKNMTNSQNIVAQYAAFHLWHAEKAVTEKQKISKKQLATSCIKSLELISRCTTFQFDQCVADIQND